MVVIFFLKKRLIFIKYYISALLLLISLGNFFPNPTTSIKENINYNACIRLVPGPCYLTRIGRRGLYLGSPHIHSFPIVGS